MKLLNIFIIFGIILMCEVPTNASETFADETAVSAVSREDQTNAIKIGLLKQEVTLTTVIRILTTFRIVNEQDYSRTFRDIQNIRHRGGWCVERYSRQIF